MRHPADLLGLTGFLFVMYGGVPDPELLSAAFNGELSDIPKEEAGRPYLSLVPSRPDPNAPKGLPQRRRPRASGQAAA